MAEWLKAPDSKSGVGATLPWVRIPPLPPHIVYFQQYVKIICQPLPVFHNARNDNRAARLVKLIATCCSLDIDDPQPAITVMMPDEDRSTAQIIRPTGLETVQPVLLCWGLRCRPQTPPPEAWPLDSIHPLALVLGGSPLKAFFCMSKRFKSIAGKYELCPPVVTRAPIAHSRTFEHPDRNRCAMRIVCNTDKKTSAVFKCKPAIPFVSTVRMICPCPAFPVAPSVGPQS